MSKEQIIEEAMRLDELEREQVVETLRLTIPHATSEEIDRLWAEELKQRFQNLRAGKAILHDGDTVITEALSRIRNREV